MTPGARRDLLLRAYAAYSRQDIEALLALVCHDVDWPDDYGGHLRGKAAMRAYWTEQWTRTRTHDEPVSFTDLADGRTQVAIRQVVLALDGRVLSTGERRHLVRTTGGLIARLEIDRSADREHLAHERRSRVGAATAATTTGPHTKPGRHRQFSSDSTVGVRHHGAAATSSAGVPRSRAARPQLGMKVTGWHSRGPQKSPRPLTRPSLSQFCCLTGMLQTILLPHDRGHWLESRTSHVPRAGTVSPVSSGSRSAVREAGSEV